MGELVEILTPFFCFIIKIMNSDRYIDDVLKYQTHISRIQLLIGLANYKRSDDSVEDFESFALRNS